MIHFEMTLDYGDNGSATVTGNDAPLVPRTGEFIVAKGIRKRVTGVEYEYIGTSIQLIRVATEDV